MATPSFGGLGPAEAGRRSAAKRAETRRQAAENAQRQERAEIIAHMRHLATTGTGTTAVQAARYLDEVARQDAQWVSDQGLLALLTPKQRATIEAHLRGGQVSQAQAIEAWATEAAANRTGGRAQVTSTDVPLTAPLRTAAIRRVPSAPADHEARTRSRSQRRDL
jgi:hypothetical protein